ncbi:MAG: hypothetical protein WD669_03900 [Pirellulales bacterium]
MERVGELGGGLVAKSMGLEPVTGFVKQYHGFDGLFKKGNQYFILEAKGGLANLASGQMSLSWVTKNIANLPNPLQTQLRKALADNRLFGLVTKTPLDRTTGDILDPQWALNAIK